MQLSDVSLVSGPDLEREYEKIRASSGTEPAITTLRAFAVVCAVAIARVKVLERELAAVGHRCGDDPVERANAN